mmetsp:Transcript_144185/g.401729  ORF Transcript_144185/g.401729 Transcript_144185/m.401729 type:complete len:210 (-) Transcript_144185:1394-2023(-)
MRRIFRSLAGGIRCQARDFNGRCRCYVHGRRRKHTRALHILHRHLPRKRCGLCNDCGQCRLQRSFRCWRLRDLLCRGSAAGTLAHRSGRLLLRLRFADSGYIFRGFVARGDHVVGGNYPHDRVPRVLHSDEVQCPHTGSCCPCLQEQGDGAVADYVGACPGGRCSGRGTESSHEAKLGASRGGHRAAAAEHQRRVQGRDQLSDAACWQP